MRRLTPSRAHHDLMDRLREGLQAVLEQHGFKHGRLKPFLPPSAEGSVPEPLRDPAEPDAAIAMLAGVPEGDRRPVERAETAQQLSTSAARDLDGSQRLGGFAKSGHRLGDRRTHYLVVETHVRGAEPLLDAGSG
jgi:hypothetical protein